MGLCEFVWKDYIEAADRFKESLELGLSRSMAREATFLKGLSHYHIQEYSEAIDDLDHSMKLGRSDSPVYFYKGLCLLETNKTDEALSCLQESLSRGPAPDDMFNILFYIAFAYKEKGDYQGALDYLNKAQAIEPDSYEIYNLKGFCYFKMKQYDFAISCFEKAISLRPDSAIDYATIGSNLRDKGDIRGACDMYRKALKLDPHIEFARTNLRRLETIMKNQKDHQ